jgi:hypothetical protein
MNKYLEKIASTRLVRELVKGSVPMSVNSLFRRGALRSPARYAKGMREGVGAIAKKVGADFTAVKRLDTVQGDGIVRSGGYTTVASRDGGIHIYHDKGISSDIHIGESKARKDIAHQSGLMHESFEAEQIRRDLSRGVIDTGAAQLTLKKYKEYALRKGIPEKSLKDTERFLNQAASPASRAVLVKDGKEVARHQSLVVLGKESNMIRTNPYLRVHGLSKNRMESGEANFISKITGKKYGVDRFTGKDLKKLDKKSPTIVINGSHIHDLT